MAEYFTQYHACSLDVDALIEDIWEEKQSLSANAQEDSRAVKRELPVKGRKVGWECVQVLASDFHRQGEIMEAVLMTLDAGVRDTVRIKPGMLVAAVREGYVDVFEKATREGRSTYISPEKRVAKKSIAGKPPVPLRILAT